MSHVTRALGIVLIVCLFNRALVPASAQTPTLTIAIAGATLTLTPTADQVTALLAVVDAYNANERKDLPAWTVNQWIRQILLDRVQSAVQAHRATGAQTACEAYEKLTVAKQNAIKLELGNKSPCA